jgi:uncharacterized protein (TIGR03083 family)
MDSEWYLDELRAEGGRLGAAARAAPTAPVPSCPGWDMRQLLAHIEAIHRWVVEIVRTKARRRPARAPVGDEVGFADLVASYDAGLAALVAALAATDPAEPLWNWHARGLAPAHFWFRRMAQETAVHRWDAEAAGGAAAAIDAALAIDGVHEFLGFVAAALAEEPIAGLHGSLLLIAADSDARWQLNLAPDRLDAPGSAPQATVCAAASDLYLWLLHRLPADAAAVTVTGEAAPIEAWRLVVFD